MGDIMQTPHTTSTTKIEFQTFIVRLGKIFSNLSILFLVLSLCGVLSFVALAFVILIGFTLIILSIGTIFVYVPNYWDILTKATDISVSIANFFLQNIFVFIPLTILFAIVSLILLKLDKQNSHTVRIVLSSIIIGVAVIAIIVLLVGGLK